MRFHRGILPLNGRQRWDLCLSLSQKIHILASMSPFLSIEDTDHVTRLVDPFHLLASGIISIPIDFPGTRFNTAIRAAKFLRNEFTTITIKKKHELAMQMATPTQDLWCGWWEWRALNEWRTCCWSNYGAIVEPYIPPRHLAQLGIHLCI